MNKPSADNPGSRPLGLPLNDQLGLLPERVAAAGCPPPGWVEPGAVPSPVGRLYTQAELDAAIEAAREQERGRWEGVVFDGWRVLKGLDEAAAKRTTHQNVSDTLDALMRVLRA